jgi:hypothetical protein
VHSPAAAVVVDIIIFIVVVVVSVVPGIPPSPPPPPLNLTCMYFSYMCVLFLLLFICLTVLTL